MHYGHYLDKKSVELLSDALVKHYAKQPARSEIVILCIGTNRYAWDALGPYVGTRLLERLQDHAHIRVYGTLEQPVHALNLQRQLAAIAKQHPNAYQIAVDACLGQFYKIGTLQFVEEPLEPGAGLEKRLPPVGHVHIKGIINNHEPLSPKVLEDVSVSHTIIREMAAVVSRVLVKGCSEIVPLLAPAAAPVAPLSRPVSSSS